MSAFCLLMKIIICFEVIKGVPKKIKVYLFFFNYFWCISLNSFKFSSCVLDMWVFHSWMYHYNSLSMTLNGPANKNHTYRLWENRPTIKEIVQKCQSYETCHNRHIENSGIKKSACTEASNESFHNSALRISRKSLRRHIQELGICKNLASQNLLSP